MEQEEFLDEYTYYDDVEYESRFHEMIKQHAEELVFTRQVLYSLLHRHLSNNLNYQYSKAKYYGLMISHTEIARLCGVSPRIGVKWFDDCEKGLPGLEALSSLSLFFGCTLRELIVCHNDSADNTGDLSKNHPYLYYMDHVSEFKAKCKENSSSLRQVLGRNLKNQYSMMRNHNEKINYSKIAKLCGVSPATVHRWFNNCERLPGIKDLLILAIIFGCHVSELIECSDGRCQQEYYPKRPYVERLEAQERYYYGDGDMILQKVWDSNETIEYYDYW